MKSQLSFLAVIAAVSVTQFASADIIDSVVVNDGTNDITLSVAANTNPADGTDGFAPQYPTGSTAALQSFVSGGVNYTTLIGADGFVSDGGNALGDAEGQLFATGAFPVPADATITASTALSDLDLSTGTLDPYGTSNVTGVEYFDFRSQTITDETVFFLFANATPSQAVALVDASGADITNALAGAADLGGEAQLNDFNFERTNGGPLNSREVFGNTFAVSEFTFNDGFTVADVAGFRGQGGTFDAQDAGIAIATSVPEPSSALLLVGGLGVFLVRRRRK